MNNSKKILRWCIPITWIFAAANVAYLIVLSFGALAWLWVNGILAPIPAIASLVSGETVYSAYWVVTSTHQIIVVIAYTVNAFWIYHASLHAAKIDPDPTRIGPAWTVAWFLIPIANLWMPYRAMKQVWHSSSGIAQDINAPVSKEFALWWGCWTISWLASAVSYRVFWPAGEDGLLFAIALDLVAVPFAIISAFLFLRIMKDITGYQQERTQSDEVFA